jgi:hypothetical protein
VWNEYPKHRDLLGDDICSQWHAAHGKAAALVGAIRALPSP